MIEYLPLVYHENRTEVEQYHEPAHQRKGCLVRIGILSDTHDELHRTRNAIELLQAGGAKAIIHCGDLIGPEILAECAVLPLYFAFGNHDCDMVPVLEQAAKDTNSCCLRWGGEITLAEKRIAVVHGHMTMDLRPLLQAQPDYLLTGHSHIARDWLEGSTRRINPGALHRTDQATVVLLDLVTDELQFISVCD